MLWTDAARFVNRLNVSHGYPAAYNASTRFDLCPESNNGFDPNNQFRNRLAKFVLISADEWHKAAYYDPSKMVERGYWLYPTGFGREADSSWVKQLADTNFGDSDLDGEVAFNDFLAVANSFDQPSGWAGGDFDGNGLTDFQDFLLLANNFGKTRESDVASVPEPCSSFLMFLAVVPFLVAHTRAQMRLILSGSSAFCMAVLCFCQT